MVEWTPVLSREWEVIAYSTSNSYIDYGIRGYVDQGFYRARPIEWAAPIKPILP